MSNSVGINLGFKRFLNVRLTDYRALIACLTIGFLVRLAPEILAFPNPIGFDIIDYASMMNSGIVLPNWSAFFTSTWLLNAIIVPLYGFLQVDPFLLLKVIAPLLYGLNVAGIYWFARKNLGWSMQMGLAAGVFFALQLASLRISWDLLRNTLGLGILLFALSYVKEIKSNRGLAIFAVLSLVSVFAHEYAAVTLLFVVVGLIVWRFIKGRSDISKRLLLGSLPALSVFSIGMYLRMFPITLASVTNIIRAGDVVNANPGRIFFLVDYLHVKSSVDFYGSYTALALSVGLLFVVLFGPYLYLVLKGVFHNRVLTLWTILLLIGSFGCLVVPFSALTYWHRWMFMLAYPFTFYAVYGLSKLFSKTLKEGKVNSLPMCFNKKVAVTILLTFSLGIAYLASPILMVYANTSVPSLTGTYLYFSNSPTVPYQDVGDVTKAMNWLNNTMDSSSCVVLQYAYLFWGQLYLDKSHSIVTFENNDVNLAVNTALAHNFTTVYFVCWNEPIGWYNLSVPESFVSLQDFGRISVFVYGGSTFG